jgi:biopolymer transport protein ExbD
MWPGVGILLLGLLVCGASVYWFSSRIFVALDEPISLHHGHNVSSEFKINVSEYYFIDIVPEEQLGTAGPSCSPESAVQSEWTLTRNGTPIQRSADWDFWGRGSSEGLSLGLFLGPSGSYRLDINELADPRCLNVLKPRLLIETADDVRYSYKDDATRFSCLGLVVAGAGVFLLLWRRPALFEEHRQLEPLWDSPPDERITSAWSPLAALRARRRAGFTLRPLEQGWNVQFPIAGRNPANAASMMAMACCLCMTLLVFPTYLLHVMGTTPQGMMVRVLGPRTVVGSELAGETLALWIDARNQWYFNSKPTTPRELPRLLRDGLVRQASQVVYVGADDNLEFNAVARAIDIVRREHAQVILITTRDRADAAGAVPRK